MAMKTHKYPHKKPVVWTPTHASNVLRRVLERNEATFPLTRLTDHEVQAVNDAIEELGYAAKRPIGS